jgi:predicted RNA-binding protein with TRAM domain/predicted transcriptional regulator
VVWHFAKLCRSGGSSVYGPLEFSNTKVKERDYYLLLSTNRNRAEIYATLLRGALSEETERVTITRLMYVSMLSYRQLNIHLQVLLKNRLIEYHEEKIYKITIRGRQFLEPYTKMAEMLKPIT